MKKNKTMRAASFLLVLTLMTSCFVGSTFAKYTSTQTAQDSVRVAKWSFEVENSDIATTSYTFDLFETADLDPNVKNTGDLLIAPGTTGNFELNLENTSEVAAEYGIDYTVTKGAIPIEFRVDGGAWTADLADVVIDSAHSTMLAPGAAKTIIIEWQWVFEAGDSTVNGTRDNAADTNVGIAADTVTVEAEITAQQVD